MHRAWWVLSSAFLALFALGGARNSFGVLFKPMGADFEGGRAALAGAATLGGLLLGVGYVAAGLAVDRFGPRRVIPIFAAMHLAGNLIVARATNLWEVYLGYGVLGSLAFGIGVGPFLSIVTRWFRRYQGLAIGITASAAPLGVVVFSPVISVMADGPGWRWTFVFLAVVPFIGLLMAASVVQRRPQDVGLEPYGAGALATVSSGADVSLAAEAAVTAPHRAFRKSSTWLVLFIYVGANVSSGVVLFHLVNFGTDEGLTSVVAAGLLSAMSGVSVVGRVVLGVLSERFSISALFTASLLIMAVATGVLPLLSGVAGYYLFASVYGFSLGGTVVIMPLMGRALFGEEYLGAMLGVMLLSINIGSAAGALLGGAVFDATDSYTLAFLGAAAAVAVASFGALRLRI